MRTITVMLVLTCLLLTSSIVGCVATEAPSTQTPADSTVAPTAMADSQSDSVYGEAPQLAKRVAAGELPPVEERLPANPVVIQPVERGGVYGGTWRFGVVGINDYAMWVRMIGYEGLLRWDSQWQRVVPNLAQSLEINEDATEFTFHLREGLRWSDGMPFTADDILFYYEAIYLNEKLTPDKPSILTAGGDPMEVEKVDDYTFIIRFQVPYGLFPQKLATPPGAQFTLYPRHYLEKYHPDYNPDGVDALIEEAGVENWNKNFKSLMNFNTNAALPTLHAWVLSDDVLTGDTEAIAVRNPYYWKIDNDFNQLPYIDRVQIELFDKSEEIRPVAMAGNIDMDCYRVDLQTNPTEYQVNMAVGNYHLSPMLSSQSNEVAISMNQTHPDPFLRAIFQNRDFRIALSHAIDRQAIIDQVYGGQGVPYQVAPRPDTPFYNERLATQYLEYDIDWANEILDQIDYDQRDAEGYRLGPDNRRISFTIYAHTFFGSEALEAAQMIGLFWQAVGLDVTVQQLGKKDLETLRLENKHDVSIGTGAGGFAVMLEPQLYFPANGQRSSFAILWGKWYSDNATGEMPPSAARQQMILYDQLTASGSADEQVRLMAQILEISAEQFYMIGITSPRDRYCLVKNNFHNVPEYMPASWTFPTPAPTNPCQYFIDPQE